ncbi:hypothetical protein KDL01_09185 [Actinospica durhamensis]|uniref:Transposase n=1 Tax=Actinospica durhamensis TaxID=1508375 RepID=A0A941EM60_9ACTN|nr:hypothetical protein [Actinospica durhamensis]MBR7833438.1 hypothetical protein [Actinospica durhamensis]
MIGSRSLRAAKIVAAADRGYGGGKRVHGTNRHVAVDALGPLLTVRLAIEPCAERQIHMAAQRALKFPNPR